MSGDCLSSVLNQRNRYLTGRDPGKRAVDRKGIHCISRKVDGVSVCSTFKSSPQSAITAMHVKVTHLGFSRSRDRSFAWWCASAMVCGGSLAWMPQTPVGSASVAEVTSVRLVVGWIGLFFAAGFGVAGLLCWPSSQNFERRKQGSSVSAYDSITGLPTRRLYLALLGHALSRAEATTRNVAVLV